MHGCSADDNLEAMFVESHELQVPGRDHFNALVGGDALAGSAKLLVTDRERDRRFRAMLASRGGILAEELRAVDGGHLQLALQRLEDLVHREKRGVEQTF